MTTMIHNSTIDQDRHNSKLLKLWFPFALITQILLKI